MPSAERSLGRRILLPIAGLLVFAGITSAVAAFFAAQGEMTEMLDYQLTQLCRVVASEVIARGDPTLPANSPTADYEDNFVVYVWDRNGRLVRHTPGAPNIERPEPGFATVSTWDGGWRLYSERVGGAEFTVAQPLELRTEVAVAGALQVLLPLLVLIPLLAVLIGWIVLRSLKPLRALSADVERRVVTDLRPLSGVGLPNEVQPLLRAVNGLLARLHDAMTQQKRFVVDAAHEMRSPLGALQIQAEMLEAATGEDERRARARALRAGIARLTGLVSQLLTMARLDAAIPSQPVVLDLLEVTKEAIADLYPLAESRSINLGLEKSESAPIRGYPAGLRALVANLVDNALRYTPEGGQVDVSVSRTAGGALLAVSDTGPGIPSQDLERVFDRFFRVEGSGVSGHGLGLAIARAAAQQQEARIHLENRSDAGGLRATVEFTA